MEDKKNAETTLTTFFESLVEGAQEAEEEALKLGIETNAVIISDKFDFANRFICIFKDIVGERNLEVSPMVLGKKLLVAPLPQDYDFMLTYSHNVRDYINEVEEQLRILKKYIKVIGDQDNEQIVFKGVSSKKNKRDFELIKNMIKG